MEALTPTVGPPNARRELRRAELLLWGLVAAIAVGAYFYRLGEIPRGLFIDETSVGFNARCIVQTGADEFGARFPLFFRGLDDYKSPILVYAAALTTGLLGATSFAVRLPSALLAIAFSGVVFFLVKALTNRARLARWLAVLALLFPTTLIYGRHAVSEASALGVSMALVLLALVRWADAPSLRRAAAAGALTALCTYTYTTQRLYAPLMALVASAIFLLDARTRRTAIAFAAAAGAGCLPYALYLLIHPGMLSRRFNSMSIFRDHPSSSEAAWRFLSHYTQHLFSFDFLFRTGDANLRHNLPSTGFFPVWLAVPLVLGLAAAWKRRGNPAFKCIIAFIFLSPLPVALTHDAWPHATRMLHLVPLALVCVALAAADWLDRPEAKKGFVTAVASLALLEGGQLLYRYFVEYPAAAGPYFDEGEDETLRVASSARRPNGLLFAPENFFIFEGTKIEYAADLDCVRNRQEGLGALGFRVAYPDAHHPSGSVVVVRGNGWPYREEQARELAVVRRTRDSAALWSVYRVD